ncbi:MAG: hypothetical protein ACLFVG_10225 [Candidatus Aminicenantes bacterium]
MSSRAETDEPPNHDGVYSALEAIRTLGGKLFTFPVAAHHDKDKGSIHQDKQHKCRPYFIGNAGNMKPISQYESILIFVIEVRDGGSSAH